MLLKAVVDSLATCTVSGDEAGVGLLDWLERIRALDGDGDDDSVFGSAGSMWGRSLRSGCGCDSLSRGDFL